MNLIFEGGGIKGLSYVGALRSLEERGIKISKAGGNSVGAIFAALVVAGYNSYELEAVLNQINPESLWPKSKSIYDKIKKKSIYPIDPLENLLHNLLKIKCKTRFRDIKIGNDYALKVVTTYLKRRELIVLPDDLPRFGYNPDEFPIAKAVCMSASLPVVYPSYKLGDFSFIDGGLIDNFPIWLYDEPIIGFRVHNYGDKLKLIRNKVFKNNHNTKGDYDNIVYIDTSNYKTTDFKKGMLERYYLFNSGYYYTKSFLDKYFLRKV